ncbi:LysR family transcriptional regulator [Brevibacillus ginsengisoli]|uniref:LysR family transcriptional regulator n=1 Tax=Brevibacillus ginsengisoli TaxID=363854 RepID=UPI003CF9BAE7
MELRQARYVLAVASERSFSKAAALLHLAQPSLSQQIAKLEKEWGVQLFHRYSQQIELTDAGERFVQVAQALIDKAEGLEREMRAYAKADSGKLVIGSLPITGTHVLPNVLSAFHQQYPGIELKLVEERSSQLEEMLLRGKLDVSLLTMPITDPQLLIEPIIHEEIFLAVPPLHPMAHKAVVSIEALADQNFILLKEGQGFRQISMDLCQAAGFKPTIVFESTNIQTVQSLVAAGMGISFIPQMITRSPWITDSPVYVRLESRPHRTLVMAVHKDRHLSLPVKAFMEVLRRISKSS